LIKTAVCVGPLHSAEWPRPRRRLHVWPV